MPIEYMSVNFIWVLNLNSKPEIYLFLQGYMWKKGHRRKNWTERWFVLKPNIISYYVSEDLKDKRGDITLDDNCSVEVKKIEYF